MTKDELLQKIKYYKIKVDKVTKTYIKERLVSIDHRIDTHVNGNEYKVYSFKELIPYGKRAYKGSKVYEIYNQVLEARENAIQNMNELRDQKANPSNWASDDEIFALFNTVGKTNIGKQA